MAKKIRHIRLALVTQLLVLLSCFPVYAGNATLDILDNPRFEGALQWVNWIGGMVDNGFTFFISITAFFIISAACLRNVLAGAYCVFPKFWDKVDEAHKITDAVTFESAKGFFTGGFKNASTGSVTQFLLGLIPNIKVLTDFEDAQDPDYKQYFMRAIPQCVCAVFVGVFIYNGYYRDVMKLTSEFGSQITVQALSTVKPENILYRLTNISGIPPYGVKDAESGIERIADELVKTFAKEISDVYDDQNEKANKTKMYTGLSDTIMASSYLASMAEFADESTWKVSVVNSGIQEGVPQLPATYRASSGDKITMSVSAPVSSFNLSTNRNSGVDYYTWATLQFDKLGASKVTVDSSTVNDFVLTLPIPTKSGSTWNVALPSSTTSNRLDGGSQYNTKIGDISCTVDANKITFNDDPTVFTSSTLVKCENLWYNSKNRFSIVGVKFSSSGSGTLYSASTGISIKVGDSVEDAYNAMKQSGSLPTSTEADGDDVDISDLEEGAD